MQVLVILSVVAVACAKPAAVFQHGPAVVRTVVQQPAVQQVVVDQPAGTSSQFHAQDELGQYEYGYSNEHSSKHEVKSADGVVQGSFSYASPDGRVITNNYVADGLGFRSDNAPTDGLTQVVQQVQPVLQQTVVADVPQVQHTVQTQEVVPQIVSAKTVVHQPAVKTVYHTPSVAVQYAPSVAVKHVQPVAVQQNAVAYRYNSAPALTHEVLPYAQWNGVANYATNYHHYNLLPRFRYSTVY